MTTTISIGIISDLDDQRASQLMTDTALFHTAEHLSIEIQQTWLTINEGHHVDAEHVLHLGMLIKIIQHNLADFTSPHLDNDTHTIFV